MFESGAIVLHIGEKSETLLPRDPAERARALTWSIAALNTLEPTFVQLVVIDIFNPDATWGKERRPAVVEMVQKRLGQLSAWLGDRQYLEQSFTAGDLLVTAALRMLDYTDLLAGFPNLAAYKQRIEARPAFRRALECQIADYDEEPAVAAE